MENTEVSVRSKQRREVECEQTAGSHVILERDHRGRSADIPRCSVEQLDGVLQLQLLVEGHNAGFDPVVSEQDPP